MNEGSQELDDLIHKYNEVNVIRLIIHRRLGFLLCARVWSAGRMRGRQGTVEEVGKCAVAFYLCTIDL